MAWVKIPVENHPIFLAALPRDPRVSTLKMFGGLAALVNGNMFGGLFGRSIIVKLSSADQAEAMALDGSEPFDPMGNGRVMKDTIFLPETVMDEPRDLRDWLARAFAYTATLPPKKKSGAKASAKSSAAKAPKSSAAKKASAIPKSSTAKKASATKAKKAPSRSPRKAAGAARSTASRRAPAR
jgi:TfoX/Sxy family transcriptional regulator of competence genes